MSTKPLIVSRSDVSSGAEPKRRKRTGRVRKEPKTKEGKTIYKGHISESESIDNVDKALQDAEEIFKKLSFDPDDLADKIIAFGEVLTGIKLYSYQKEPVHRLIVGIITFEAASVTLLFSRQSGKTEVFAFLIPTLMAILPVLGDIFPELEYFKNGFKAGIFAPQSDQKDTLYSRIKNRMTSQTAQEVMSDPDINTGIALYSLLTLTNGSTCTAQTASKNSKIEGNTLDLVVMDEAQDIDDLVAQKSIEPMTTATAGSIARCGTTGTKVNHFYEEIQYNRKNDVKTPKNRRCHFEYNDKEIIRRRREQFKIDGKRQHLLYEKVVKKFIDKWGENSPSFQLSYRLVWRIEDNMFMPEDAFWKYCNKRLKIVDYPDTDVDDPNVTYSFGIDWAKEGCSTVVTVIRSTPNDEEHETIEEYDQSRPNKRIMCWVELPGEDYEEQHYSIMELVYLWLPSVIYSDATGVGNAPTDRLIYAVPETTTIVPYVFSTPSKSEMWTELYEELKGGRLVFPAHKSAQESAEFNNFKIQLTTAVKRYDRGYLVVGKPSRKYLDDYLDSLGLANLAANSEPDFDPEVEDEENPIYSGMLSSADMMRNSSW